MRGGPVMQLIIAEKPSVGRDLARVLDLRGGRGNSRSQIEGPTQVVTWCVGHLVELDEPASYDPRWKSWRLDTLPMLPAAFKLRPVTGARDQLQAVQDLMRDRRFTEVVNACDAGREGELIFRYVYELAGCRLPVRRLWISSMTDEAIKDGFARLRPGRDYDPLADAARCRSEADWLVGLNATRAMTVRHRRGEGSTLYSIGRVQTPTLAILVNREQAIRRFVPRDYFEVRGTFGSPQDPSLRFHAPFTLGKLTRFGSRVLAEQIVARASRHSGAPDPVGPRVEAVDQRRTREPPPFLFDLTSLQRTANRRFGLSASRTLELAQSLYERHKVLTYPRTDSRHLSGDMVAELPKLFRALAGVPEYQVHTAPLLVTPPTRSRRVFDDAKVHDHHAIIPTGKIGNLASLDRDERRIFDLVARRFLGAFHPDAEFALTVAVLRIGPGEDGVRAAHASTKPATIEPAPGALEPTPGSAAGIPDPSGEAFIEVLPPPPDRFIARGRVRLVAGWQAVAGLGAPEGGPRTDGARSDGADDVLEQSLPPLEVGQRLDASLAVMPKQTKPPPRHSEATLLAAMETAGRTIEDDELRLAMKEGGLGTPATRAATIETLLRRGFVERQAKQLMATDLGVALVTSLPVPSLASPELTGRWEARLARIARGGDARQAFMRDIAAYVTDMVDTIRQAPPSERLASAPRTGLPAPGSATGASISAPHRASASGPGAPGPRGSGAKVKAKSEGEAKAKAKSEGEAQAKAKSEGEAKANAKGGPAAQTVKRIRPPRSTSTGAADGPGEGAPDVTALACPRCRIGKLLVGKRGWGCTRWRQGCAFVIWFEHGGRALSAAQVAELVTKGRTRKGKWPPAPGAAPAVGRLVLDPHADRGAAKFQPG